MSVEQIKQKYDATLKELRKRQRTKLILGRIRVALILLFLFLFFLTIHLNNRLRSGDFPSISALYTTYFLFKLGFTSLIAVFPLLIYYYILYSKTVKDNDSYFKSKLQEIWNEVAVNIHPSLKFDMSNYIEEEDFNRSLMFSLFDFGGVIVDSDYEGSGYVEGKIGSVNIRFSNVRVLYDVEKDYEDSNGNRSKAIQTVEVFKGIFVILDFNKEFRGPIHLFPTSVSSLAYLGNVKLESPEFNRYFYVFARDQTEARYVLSTSLMERLLKYISKIETVPYVSFVMSKMYIGIPDMLLPTYVTTFDLSLIDEIYYSLSIVVSVIDDLDLNTRIWSKM